MFLGSNCTAEEELRLTGTVTGERLNNLLDQETQLTALKDVAPHIQEALGQFPAEDFLEEHKTRLVMLAKNMRGANKEALQAIIETLDDISMTTFYASDYGSNELRQALGKITKAK